MPFNVDKSRDLELFQGILLGAEAWGGIRFVSGVVSIWGNAPLSSLKQMRSILTCQYMLTANHPSSCSVARSPLINASKARQAGGWINRPESSEAWLGRLCSTSSMLCCHAKPAGWRKTRTRDTGNLFLSIAPTVDQERVGGSSMTVNKTEH